MAINRIKTGGITDGTIQSGDLAPGTIANDRLANTGITINGTSIALGASGEIVAGTDWQAVTVADGSTTVNASAGQGYFLDTNAGVIEVFLPTSPTQGDTVILVDYAGTFATNNVIVNTGGVAIDSTVGSDFILSTNNRIAEFVYVDSNKGWLYKGATTKGSTPSQVGVPVYDSDEKYIVATGGTITTVDTDYKVHTFTGDGCFVVSCAGNPAGSNTVDYLVVAGGGGGGYDRGGGGGAGGYRESHSVPVSGCYTASPLATPTGITLTATTYPITVGGGGAGISTGPAGQDAGTGSNSIFSTITSAGGGRAGSGGSCSFALGGPGGSGGGSDAYGFPPGAPGLQAGSGNTPPTSPPQGNPGGVGIFNSPNGSGRGGGGGGATAAGTSSTPGGNPGGAGATTSISGTPTAYSGGGGGSTDGPVAPTGGSGVGGNGGAGGSSLASTAGTTNRGGGGGGGSGGPPYVGEAGGSGIVIIRYKFQ